MNRQIILLIGMVIFIKLTIAQTLQVGDKLPALKFKKVLAPDKEVSLQPHKHKLTILDFWGHGCSSCIESFPKVEKLQAMFGDSVQIIMVNKESKDSTESLFAKRDWIKKPQVKMISGDTLLHKLFDVRAFPRIVWLDEELNVKYIAHAISMNAANIRKFLRGEHLNSKPVIQTDVRASLFDKAYESDLQSFSYLALTINGLRFSGGDWGIARSITARNVTVLYLIQSAFGGFGSVNWRLPWKTTLNVRNPDLYRRPEHLENPEEWDYKHTYVYHLLVPEGRERDKYEFMKKDLANYFSLKFSWDTISMETLVLKRTGNKDKLKSKGGKGFSTFRRRNESAKGNLFADEKRILKNQPFVAFLNTVRGMIEGTLQKPFVNDTHYEGNVDMEFDGLTLDFFTLEGLNEELERYGLKVVPEIRPVETLVISDRD